MVERWADKWDNLDLNEEQTLAERKFIKKYSTSEQFKYQQTQSPSAFKQALDEHLDDVLPKRKAKCTTVCEGVSLKITLTEKFLVRTFESALIAPYLTAFNKKRTDEAPVAPSDVAEVTVDGKSVIEKMQVRAMDVLTRDNHDVVLTLKVVDDDDDGLVLEEQKPEAAKAAEVEEDDDDLVLEKQ